MTDVGVQVLVGDHAVVLGGLPDCSVDAVITVPRGDVWGQVFRVVKPGGHVVAFTDHRGACQIEDAGFQIRDCLTIATSTGIEPAVLARKPLEGTVVNNTLTWGTGALNIDAARIASSTPVQASAGGLDDSPIYGSSVARYELGTGREYTTNGRWPANLLLVHNAGCRQAGTRTVRSSIAGAASGGAYGTGDTYGDSPGFDQATQGGPVTYAGPDGLETVESWVCEPGCPVQALDDQSGERPSSGGAAFDPAGTTAVYGSGLGRERADRREIGFGDTGGASRFFARFGWAYDVNMEAVVRDFDPVEVPPALAEFFREVSPGDDGVVRVAHPTVKPLSLIRYLVKLLAPPPGPNGEPPVILDPFAGSGTTMEACVLEGVHGIGVELTDEYLPLIEARIARGYRGGPDYPDPVEQPADPDTPTLF